MSHDIPLTKRTVTVESREIKQSDWNEQSFFPFQEYRERHQVKLDQHAASFPMLGIVALVGALTLIALSGAILLVIEGPGKVVSDWTVHVYKTHRHVTIPKPAAWLSGILSGISICFHIALSEGLNIAWWYHVRQENATVRDLHDIWGHGTSTWEVVKSGAKDLRDGFVGVSRKMTGRQTGKPPYSQRRHFSYVALATLFVATIPLNGFLLQNAVIVVLAPATKIDSIKVPMLNGDNFLNVQQVYATGDQSSGGVSDWSAMLGTLSQTLTPKVAAAADLGSFNTTCLGSCKTTVKGMGFNIQCEDSTQPYNIPINPPQSSLAEDPYLESMVVNGTDVMTLVVTYNYLKSNRVTMRSTWKDSATCEGKYTVQTCNLDLATVEYPIVINSGVQEATQSGLRNTTIMTLDLNLLKESPKVVSLAPSQNSDTTFTTTYAGAGLAGLFAQTLNSSINLSYTFSELDYGSSRTAQGIFAQQMLATTGVSLSIYPQCKGTIGNVTQQALATIQSMMFQLGAYNWLSSYGDPTNPIAGFGSQPSAESTADFLADQTPRPIAIQSYQRNEYKVVWSWYFGAMAVTLLVSMFILPTFWGYWRLERKTTMSPFETARAFHAPILYQEDSTVESNDLIRKVGDVRIHRDLLVSPVSEPGSSRIGSAH
jgi:Protein of unknown function (DUF3176)